MGLQAIFVLPSLARELYGISLNIAGLHVVATAASADLADARGLGAERVVDYRTQRFEESVTEWTSSLIWSEETCSNHHCES